MPASASTTSAPLDLPGDPKSLTHPVFKFPGKIHPPLVADLLRRHPDAERIADPMAGCGTVAVEAAATARQGLFMDIDPLSCLITRAKANPVDPDDLTELGEQIVADSGPFPVPGTISQPGAIRAVKRMEASTPHRAPPNLWHWFDPYVVKGLADLFHGAHHALEHERERVHDAVHATLASTIRKVSRADPAPVSCLGVTRVRKEQLGNGLTFDVQARFLERVQAMADGYRAMRQLDSLGRVRVVPGDAREWSATAGKHRYRVELGITSPPYCGAIEYWRRHRLEYFWIGLLENDEIPSLRRKMVGTSLLTDRAKDDRDLPGYAEELIRAVKKSSDRRHADVLRQYCLDTASWLESFRKTMEDRAPFYVIVGPNRVRGVDVDTPRLVNEIAKTVGYEAAQIRYYKTKNNHMQYPTRNDAQQRTEAVLMLTNAAS